MTITIQRPVLRDTREKPGTGWFEPGTAVEGFAFESEVATLRTADYSLRGLEHEILIERKTVPDLLGCIGHGRSRFEAMLERMSLEAVECWVLIEGSRHELETGQHRSRVSPASVVGSLMAWSCDFQVKIWWSSTRELAERDCLRLFRRIENRAGAQVNEEHAGRGAQGSA